MTSECIPAVETHMIRSRYVKQIFKIQVACPAQKKGEVSRFPVVYATDANLLFDALKGISYSIQASDQVVPRFILVGIGYPSDSPFAGSLLRARDMTFPHYPRLDTNPGSLEGVLVAEEGTKDFYGAEDFQEFIGRELIPLIEEQYPTVPGSRAYFGHSLGGGFGLFTLFARSDLFNKYVISSPGLTFHGEAQPGTSYENHDFVLRHAQSFISSGKSLRGVSLYMSVGTGEEFEPGAEMWQLTSSFYRMARLLKVAAIPGLRLMLEAFPGETHMTVWPMAFIHGVQAVFATGLWGKEVENRVR